MFSPSLHHCTVQLSCTDVRWCHCACREEECQILAHLSSLRQRKAEMWPLWTESKDRVSQWVCRHACASTSLQQRHSCSIDQTPINGKSAAPTPVTIAQRVFFFFLFFPVAVTGNSLVLLPCQGVHYVVTEIHSPSQWKRSFFWGAAEVLQPICGSLCMFWQQVPVERIHRQILLLFHSQISPWGHRLRNLNHKYSYNYISP